MFWWLLLYPLVGAVVAAYCVYMYAKYDPMDAGEYWMVGAYMFFLWPIYVWFVVPELWVEKKEALAKPARELEALIERIRKEPDPLLADWDREFNELAGIEEPKPLRIPAVQYENGFNNYGRVLELKPYPTSNSKRYTLPNENIFWYPHETIDDFRLCEAPQISQGGLVPTTAELNDSAEFRVRDLGSHFSL